MKTIRPFLVLAFVVSQSPVASATTISFTATNLSGNNWQYDYAVSNDSLSNPIDEFTIYFDLGTYSNLNVRRSPTGWDSLVIQPDPGIPADGYFDALALNQGIAPGTTVVGFQVSFEYLGTGTPGSQSFEIVDPLTFSAIDSGLTVAASTPPPPPQSIPEPGPVALLAVGLAALLTRRTEV